MFTSSVMNSAAGLRSKPHTTVLSSMYIYNTPELVASVLVSKVVCGLIRSPGHYVIQPLRDRFILAADTAFKLNSVIIIDK